MRRVALCLLLSASACRPFAAAQPSVPTLDERARELVLAVGPFGWAPVAAPLCVDAATARDWRERCIALGGDASALPEGFSGFAVERLVALAWPPGAGLVRIEGASEEGVDVLTFVAGPVPGGGVGANGCLARLPRRPNQLAVVWRDGSGERTLAVFPSH